MTATMNIDQARGMDAASAVSKFHFVKQIAGTPETVEQCNTAGEKAYGVSLFSVSAAEIALGKGVTVVTDGRMILVASEQIHEGDFVSTAADGRARIAVTGDIILGQCDEAAAAAGDYCAVNLESYGVAP